MGEGKREVSSQKSDTSESGIFGDQLSLQSCTEGPTLHKIADERGESKGGEETVIRAFS